MPLRRRPPRRDRVAHGPSRWTVRTRVLSTLLAFIAGGLAVTGVLTFAAQFRALDQRVDAELWLEHSELALIASSTEADGSSTHTTVDGLLLHATDSAVPSNHESVVALVDEEPRHQPRQQDFSLLPQPTEGMSAAEVEAVKQKADQVTEQILDARVPDRTVIVPMESDGRDLWQSYAVFAGLSALTLLLGGWVRGRPRGGPAVRGAANRRRMKRR